VPREKKSKLVHELRFGSHLGYRYAPRRGIVAFHWLRSFVIALGASRRAGFLHQDLNLVKQIKNSSPSRIDGNKNQGIVSRDVL